MGGIGESNPGGEVFPLVGVESPERRVLSLAVADCLRLICLTGVRRSEAVAMRFDQVTGDRWIWHTSD